MQIASSWSTHQDSSTAIHESCVALKQKLGCDPQYIFVYASCTYDCSILLESIQKQAPKSIVCGSTSCMGIMTEEGFHSDDGQALGLLAINDSHGSYGTATANLDNNPREAGRQAIIQALNNAQRPGEVPSVIWLAGAPGEEEEVLLGIEDIVGNSVPILGGSAADNSISGDWKQFHMQTVYHNNLVLCAMFPSTSLSFAFRSGYAPSQHQGVVTRAEGRVIYEIDHEPAVDVYNRWTGGLFESFSKKEEHNIISVSTLKPLARIVGCIEGIPYYNLSHPLRLQTDGAIHLFSNVTQGETITLMEGSKDSLIARAAHVVQEAMDNQHWHTDNIAGSFVVYCAGCMLEVKEHMPQVADEITTVLNHKPFLGIFTFGEQGCFVGGENRHGNLMISSLIFSSDVKQ